MERKSQAYYSLKSACNQANGEFKIEDTNDRTVDLTCETSQGKLNVLVSEGEVAHARVENKTSARGSTVAGEIQNVEPRIFFESSNSKIVVTDDEYGKLELSSDSNMSSEQVKNAVKDTNRRRN